MENTLKEKTELSLLLENMSQENRKLKVENKDPSIVTFLESNYLWVTGQRIYPDVTYWRCREPYNATASWDNSQAGQDCVAIVPPTEAGLVKRLE